jgi:hypothetical protein
MDMSMLAELRNLGVYLFPRVQKTTQITHETDQTTGTLRVCCESIYSN